MGKQYAVFGLGSFGESVAVSLQNLGCEVVVVDNRMERIHEIADSVSYAMKADIGDPEVIRNLGTRNLDGVVVAVAEDMEASVMATLISKELGVPYVIAKAKNEIHAQILLKIGADDVIYPEREMGQYVARNLMSVNFAEWLSLSSEYSLVELIAPSEWTGRTLRELDVRKNHDISVVGFVCEGEVEVNPNPDEPIKSGTLLILVGSNDALEEFQKG